MKNEFTENSQIAGKLRADLFETPVRTRRVMRFWARLRTFSLALREFVIPTYRPERHYMRGPGPACARSSMRLER